MSSQGPFSVNAYVDGGGGNVWDVSSGTSGAVVIIGPGVTNVLKCQFDAATFSIPGGAAIDGVAIQFDAVGITDMGGPKPTVTTVEVSLGTSDLADGVSLTASLTTYPYGDSAELWGGTLTAALVNGAWEIRLAFTAHGAGGEQSSISISNVKATVYYTEGGSSWTYSTTCGGLCTGPHVGNQFGEGALNERGYEMAYKPGDTIWEQFSISGSSGGLVNADSLPTCTLVRNGTDDGAVTLTVSNVSTGRYKVTGTIPATYSPGDKIQIWLAATVSSVAGGVPILSTVIDSNRLADIVVRNSTAQGGAAGTITLDASASATDDFYKDCWIKIVSGTGANQVRLCTDYVGSTKVASVAPNWAVNPDNTSVFVVLPAAEIAAVNGAVGDLATAALAKFFTQDSGETFGAAVAGSVVKEIADNSGAGASFPANFSSLKITAAGDMSLGQILQTDLSETGGGDLADAFTKFFNVSTPAYTINNINDAYARIGANGAGLTNLGDTRIGFLDATISSRLAAADYTAPLNAAGVASAVWNAVSASYVVAGSTGKKLADAAASGDPWATALPGAYAAGEAGYILGTFLTADLNALLTNGTYGLSAIEALLANGTYGLSALHADITGLNDIAAADVWAAATRTLTSVDKTGYKLASDGLDTVNDAAPTTVPANFREQLTMVYRRFFEKTVYNKTTGLCICYADDGTTVITTQTWSDDGTTGTQGAAT